MTISFRNLLLIGVLLSVALVTIALLMNLSRTSELSASIDAGISEAIAVGEFTRELNSLLLNQIDSIRDALKADPLVHKRRFLEYSFLIGDLFFRLETSRWFSQDFKDILELENEYAEFEIRAFELFLSIENEMSADLDQVLTDLNFSAHRLGLELQTLYNVGLQRSKASSEHLKTELLHDAIRRVIFQSAAFALVIAFLYYAARKFLRPVQKLMKATERIKAGEYDFVIKLQGGKEIRDLSSSFNEMLLQLKEKRDQIESLARSLEQKVRERTLELNESREYLRSIIFGSPVAVAIFDREGVLRDCNEAFLILIGKRLKEECVDSSQVGEEEAIASTHFVAAFEGALGGHYRRTRPQSVAVEDRRKWFVHNLFPYYDTNGRLSKVICYSEDVSEQKRARDLVMAKNRELESFVYTVSHDLKAPMYSLAGLVQLLEDEIRSDPDDKRSDLMERIRKNLRHMEQMVNDLLDLSRAGANKDKFEEFNAGEVIRLVFLEEKVRSGAKQVEIELNSMPDIVADRILMSQLFRNLFSNSIKYRNSSVPLKISVTSETSDNSHVFVVSDNGRGIPEEIQPKIFDVFYRYAGESVEGSGVGLAIVKKIAESHGGSVKVVSRPDIGTSFTITLPRHDPGIDSVTNAD
jgi:signal transduction histidine kinase